MTIKQENCITLALEHARRENDYIDCDVVQEAITQLEQATTEEQATDAFAYLIVSLHYRKGNYIRVQKLRDDFNTPALALA